MKYLYILCLLLGLIPKSISAQTAKADTQQQSIVVPAPAPTALLTQLADSSRARELSYYKKMYELSDKSDAFAKGAVGISLTIAGLILAAQFIYTVVLYKREIKDLKRKFNRKTNVLQESVNTLEASVQKLEGEIRKLVKESDFNKLRYNAELMLNIGNYEAALPKFIEVAKQAYERGEIPLLFLTPIHTILRKLGRIEEVYASEVEALMNNENNNSLVKLMMQDALDSVAVIRKKEDSLGHFITETVREAKKPKSS